MKEEIFGRIINDQKLLKIGMNVENIMEYRDFFIEKKEN
jgi:hypothetical protein